MLFKNPHTIYHKDMNTKPFYDTYTRILCEELKPALGCTEPVAIAYASAAAVAALGRAPERLLVSCSGNVVKNVKGVTVPNSGGMKGIEAASILGAIGGDSRRRLEVLYTITEEHRERTRELLGTGFCSVSLKDGVAGLYISVVAIAGEESSEAALIECHDEIAYIKKNGVKHTLSQQERSEDNLDDLRDQLNIERIIDYADNVDLEMIRDVLSQQVELNRAIAEEGLRNNYGCSIGKTLKKYYDWDDVRIRARAKASAGSDVRMSGGAFPVVINSGSGNQGLTVSLPVIEYGEYLKCGEDRTLRALALSNLTAIHQKKYIGPLSAYCGAVSAAAGASAGIAYLMGGRMDAISNAISNTLAMVGGIVCDGAKASCAAKISSSLEAAILAVEMSLEAHKSFEGGDGLVKDDVEDTIKAFGKVGKDGMRETDKEILSIMLED